jgi:hypothetical protein
MGKKAVLGAVAGGLAAGALAFAMAFAGPAAAQTGGQAVAVGQAVLAGQATAADRPAYCDHVDKALDKRQRVVQRLEADAGTRGSIAWLNDKAAAATADGNSELATLYTDRSALRSQVLDPLKTIVADLTAVQQAHCN